MEFKQSEALFAQARQHLVGGVNSAVRAFKGVGGEPFFVKSGKGAIITDADGNEIVDYVLSWGPLVLGHAHPQVVEVVTKALENGSSFGIPTEAEIELAIKVKELVPSVEKLRLVSSGTEAAMSVIRLARGYTGRDKIIKVEGCYHGHADYLLVKAGSGLATLGKPSSAGVPESFTQHTLTMPYNDLNTAKALFEKHGGDIACVIIEPLPGNMGVVPPEAGYLEGLQALCKQYGALLVFDEVMSGFRAALGGAQARFGITPDLSIFGKVIGGGLPVGALGGPAEIMDHLAPEGSVYQAGTLSGNPLATAAGLATLGILSQAGEYEKTEAAMSKLGEGLGTLAKEAGVPVYITQCGSMGCMFFHDGVVRNYDEAAKSDTARYAKFFWGMLRHGVYFAPSQFEAGFTSTQHDDAILDRTLSAAKAVFGEL